jgi:hypothetical protein
MRHTYTARAAGLLAQYLLFVRSMRIVTFFAAVTLLLVVPGVAHSGAAGKLNWVQRAKPLPPYGRVQLTFRQKNRDAVAIAVERNAVWEPSRLLVLRRGGPDGPWHEAEVANSSECPSSGRIFSRAGSPILVGALGWGEFHLNVNGDPKFRVSADATRHQLRLDGENAVFDSGVAAGSTQPGQIAYFSAHLALIPGSTVASFSVTSSHDELLSVFLDRMVGIGLVDQKDSRPLQTLHESKLVDVSPDLGQAVSPDGLWTVWSDRATHQTTIERALAEGPLELAQGFPHQVKVQFWR